MLENLIIFSIDSLHDANVTENRIIIDERHTQKSIVKFTQDLMNTNVNGEGQHVLAKLKVIRFVLHIDHISTLVLPRDLQSWNLASNYHTRQDQIYFV